MRERHWSIRALDLEREAWRGTSELTGWSAARLAGAFHLHTTARSLDRGNRLYGSIRHRLPFDMLYFLHIPKTGGHSIMAALADYFAASEIAPISGPPDLVQHSPVDILNYGLIGGHLGYGLTQYVPVRMDVITFLRRPIDQALSMFFDHQANGTIECGKTLDEVLDSSDIQLLLNIQTRTLACDDLATRDVGYGRVYEDRERAIQALTGGALLEKAKTRLSSMLMVGLIEKFESSMALVCDHFGWPAKTEYAVVNARDSKDWSLVSESGKRRLASLLNLDEELYEFGRGLFERRLQERRPEIGNQDRYRARLRSEPPVRSRKITFDHPLQGYGWYEREQVGNGQYARWTGPELVSTVHVRMEADSDLRLSLLVQWALLTENVDQLRLRVNGYELEVERLFKGVGHYDSVLCTARVPRKAIHDNDITEIEIEVPRVCRPADIDAKSPDVRQLGIMVAWICLSPLPDNGAI